jgi:two-component sensor histidine kinase
LTVSDDGEGFPKDLDFRTTDSLGLQLVNALTKQLNGTIELDRSQGTAFKLTFPGPKGQPKGQEEG